MLEIGRSTQVDFIMGTARPEDVVSCLASRRDQAVISDLYVWPDQQRASVKHDEFTDAEIPLIDLACFEGENEAARRLQVAQIRVACIEWGFFQIINHNVPMRLIERVRRQALEFFGLPLAEKMTVHKEPGTFTGFGHATVKDGDVQPWAEGFYLNDAFKVDKVSRKLWPEKYNKDFAESYRDYDEEMKKLAKRLMGIIIDSLDIDVAHFDKYIDRSTGLFRWNYYPACPEPHKTLGMNVHTDFTLLTVLQLGDVGGLQLQKDDKWIAIKPRHDAFAINIGDMLQVLTNGLYTSVPHRAVVNRIDARLSLAWLFLPTPDVEVVAAPDLLSDDNAPLYRPFTLDHYTKVKQDCFLNTLDLFTRLGNESN